MTSAAVDLQCLLSDEQLFGSNNENLPKIISVVKEILSGPDRIGTEEAINQMIDFIVQHD
ncbi:hypothetical protein TSUD_123240 [Trifolium subterraneum]|uniref:Uncharacterized protein n=1 Tax=Trifolium subterraneum TaxID=3900 RepID=A0A2Z6MZY1_TRISU|nr:hypothetical protein TSUD_123240 [Trifolium subterraneum]